MTEQEHLTDLEKEFVEVYKTAQEKIKTHIEALQKLSDETGIPVILPGEKYFPDCNKWEPLLEEMDHNGHEFWDLTDGNLDELTTEYGDTGWWMNSNC